MSDFKQGTTVFFEGNYPVFYRKMGIVEGVFYEYVHIRVGVTLYAAHKKNVRKATEIDKLLYS